MKMEPKDPAWESRVRASFEKQKYMAFLGARLLSIEPGLCSIGLTYREELTQQHGFLHAGAVASVIDSACGYAGLALMPPGAGVVAVEFKINLLAPAVGTEFIATGRVIRPGRTLSVCTGELRSGDTVVAVVQGTMMTVTGRAEITD